MFISKPVHLTLRHRVGFTQHAFEAVNLLLIEAFAIAENSPSRCLVIVDESLAVAQPALRAAIERYWQVHATQLPSLSQVVTLPAGEVVKNDLAYLKQLLLAMQNLRLDRQSYVLCVGGGALQDLVGCAAAIFHRGVRLIRMPSTTLAQGDSGVGVKHAINWQGSKNLLGGFAVPWAVVNDLRLLDSLPPRIWRQGLAEAVKVALLKSVPLWDLLHKSRVGLADCAAAAGDPVWQQSAMLHLHHIVAPFDDGGGGDPFESASARPLDFGHWAAHWLEQQTDFALPHGEAVAVGLALDLCYAQRSGLIDRDLRDAAVQLLRKLQLPVWHPALRQPELAEGIEAFREHLGGPLCLPLIRGVAQPCVIHEVDLPRFKASVDDLQTLAAESFD